MVGTINTAIKFDITEEATTYIKNKLIERGTLDAAIRVGVSGSGCNGYAYRIEFTDDPAREKDFIVESNSVKVFVDQKSLLLLMGSVLDFEKTIIKHGLIIRNPNETSSCGCGKSFSIAVK